MVNTFGPIPNANAEPFYSVEGDYHLPAPGVLVHLSPPLDPPMLKGIKVHPDNPFRFEFILERGDNADAIEGRGNIDQLKDESRKLIKYFLASLTIPEKDLWVNLSPYEKDRIVPESFGQTTMGCDLLAQDYMLKQITASLIYPEDKIGKIFWKRIYEEAARRYGTTNIPVNTFNKVWIVPEKAVVYENDKVGAAYIVKSTLNVMLEEDYLSLHKHEGIQSDPAKIMSTNQMGSQIVREIILPQLKREVNENKNFARLRQVYNSLIIAAWYKNKIRDSVLSEIYNDKNKVAGVNISNPQEKRDIYERYLKAFRKGVFNIIREDQMPNDQPIARKYFSGGIVLSRTNLGTGSIIRKATQAEFESSLASPDLDSAMRVVVNIRPYSDAASLARPTEDRLVSFNRLVSALRNHIGTGSGLYEKIRSRILLGQVPLRGSENVGNLSNMSALNTFIDEHFAVPEEALREIIVNAYDAMHNQANPSRRVVDVKLGDGFMSVSDNGIGMGIDTILKKFLLPFEGGKSSAILGSIKEILNDQEWQKALRIKSLLAGINPEELSDIERLSIEDVERRLAGHEWDEGVLRRLNHLLTFTGRFGIGFYSLLYFLKSDEDFVEVITSTGREAYRVKYFMLNGELRVGIDVLSPKEFKQGTTVRLKSGIFNKTTAEHVVRKYLSFNANARINLSVDDEPPVMINREIFVRERFEKISGHQTEVYYSEGLNTTGRSVVYINVHGVNIFSKTIDGYGMPQTVVFNFPATIGLPMSRDKIDVNDLFIEKAKEVIGVIAQKPELLSAFFPCIDVLESGASASSQQVLRQEIARTVFQQWRHSPLVYLPNDEQHAKVDGRVVLVNPQLLTLVQVKGFKNPYESVWGASTMKAGQKPVYLAVFSDDTKLVALNDAVLINKKYAPRTDTQKALYNVLLGLNGVGRIEYADEHRPTLKQNANAAAAGSGQQEASPGSTIQDQILSRLAGIEPALQEDEVKTHFIRFIKDDICPSRVRLYYLDHPDLFLKYLRSMKRLGWFQDTEIRGSVWDKFYTVLGKASENVNGDIWQLVFEGNMENPQAVTKLEFMEYFLDSFNKGLIDIVVLKKVLGRIAELSYLSTLYIDESFFRSAVSLDDEHYKAFHSKIKTMLGVEPHFWYMLSTLKVNSALSIFLGHDLEYFSHMLDIHSLMYWDFRRFDFVYRDLESFVVGLRNVPRETVYRELKDIEVYQKIFPRGLTMVGAYFYLFYCNIEYVQKHGMTWWEKYENYVNLINDKTSTLYPTRQRINLQIEAILRSGMSFGQKQRFLDALLEQLEDPSETWGMDLIDEDFDPDLLAAVEHPALFLNFLSRVNVYNPFFLHLKYSTEMNDPHVPYGLDYSLRYKREIERKLIKIHNEISSLKRDDYESLLTYFEWYFEQSRRAFKSDEGNPVARIAPYISYLLDNRKAMSLSQGEVLLVNPQSRFRLSDLYNTFLGLSKDNLSVQQRAAARGVFINVDARIRKAWVSPLKDGERLRLLRNTIRAASNQSVDYLVMLREIIQNVFDETTEHKGQKLFISTFLHPGLDGSDLLVLESEDFIGMDAERLFNSFLMPFSTTKSERGKYLGKQGQGVFTILSHAEYVLLQTIKNGRARILRINPIRQNGQVVDYTIEEEKRAADSQQTDGTKIQVFLKSAAPEVEAKRIDVETRRFAGLVDAERLSIVVEGRQINARKDQRLAVEESPLGRVEFYAIPGASFLSRGGIYVKAMDGEFMAMVPPLLRPILLKHGFQVNLPFGTTERIQGGGDLKDIQNIYREIAVAVQLGALKLVISLLAQGGLQSLDFLRYDFYSTPYSHQAAEDYQLMTADPSKAVVILSKYISNNKLGKLLLAVPIGSFENIFNRPVSLQDVFKEFKDHREFFTESRRAQFPQAVQNLLEKIEKKESQEQLIITSPNSLGLPKEFIENNFIELPKAQGKGMGAYWVFIGTGDALGQMGIEALQQDLRQHPSVLFGTGLLERINSLVKHPPRGSYYFEEGVSKAHALQGSDQYAWNVFEQEESIRLWSQYLQHGLGLSKFLNLAFEKYLYTLTHEMIHLVENSGDESHDKNFFDRHKLLVSALIGRMDEVDEFLLNLRDDPQYAHNLGDVSAKDFLEYLKEHSPSSAIPGLPSVEISDFGHHVADAAMGIHRIQNLISHAFLKGHFPGIKKAIALNPSNKGGIDLTPANLRLQTQNAGQAIQFHIDPAQLAQLQNAPGFVPVIINIQPLKDLAGFLGVSQHI